MSKFTYEERTQVKNIIATLSIKRIPDEEIVAEIKRQTNKSITRLVFTTHGSRSKKILITGTRLCVKVSMSTYTSSKKG